MRQKNIERAAEALYVSQGDDKNSILGSFISDKEVRKRVKDQGRALLILERLLLPPGKFSFTKDEIHNALIRRLEKKGHRIQGDDDVDEDQFAQEKEAARVQRLAMVDNVLGKTLEDLPADDKGEEMPTFKDNLGNEIVVDIDEFGKVSLVDYIAVNTEPTPWEQENSKILEQQLEEQVQEYGIPEEVIDVIQVDLPEIAWQLIGQAYIDGVRTAINQT